jgi:hypothetical protein
MSGTPQTIFVDSADKVWFTVWVHSDNDITGGEVARLDPATNNMTRWACPPGACFGPSDMLVDGAGDVWFAEWGTKIDRFCLNCSGRFDAYIDRLDPTADPPVFTRWKVKDQLGLTYVNIYSWNPGPDQILVDGGGAAWILYCMTSPFQYGWGDADLSYLDRLQP